MFATYRAPFLLLLLILTGLAFGCSDEASSDQTALEQVKAALAQSAAGEPSAAIIALKDVIQQHPEYGPARVALAEMYLRAGLGSAALSETDKARALGVSDDALLDLEAAANFKEGRLEALETLSDLPAARTTVTPKAFMVMSLSSSGRLEQAKTLLATLGDETSSTNVAVAMARATVAYESNDIAGMRTALDGLDERSFLYPEARLLEGNLLALQGQWSEAVIPLEQAVESSALHADARLVLARALLRTGQLEAAQAQFDRAKVQKPGSPTALFVSGELALANGDEETAAQEWGSALALQRNHVLTLREFGMLRARSEETRNQAIDLLTRYTNLVDGDLNALAALADLYTASGDHAAALSVVEQVDVLATAHPVYIYDAAEKALAAGEGQKALQYLVAASSLPESPLAKDIELALGELYLVVRLPDEAISAFERASVLSPKDPEPLARVADVHLAHGRLEEAEALMLRLETEYPEHALVLAVRARLHWAHGDYDAAEAAYGKAIVLDNDNLRSKLMLARLHAEQGDRAAARALLEEIIDRNESQWVEAMIDLATLNILEKRYDAASVLFAEAVERFPKNVDALYQFGRFEHSRGHWSMAISLYEKVLAANPNVAGLQLALAQVYYASGDYETARLRALDTLRLEPNSAGAAVVLARALAQLGKNEESLNLFDQLVEAEPDNALAYFERGAMHAHMSSVDQARADFRKALELAPDLHKARLAIARLELEAGNQDHALELANEVLAEMPDSVKAFDLIGDIHVSTQQYTAADAAYTKALHIRPELARVLRVVQFRMAHDLADKLGPIVQWVDENPDDVRALSAYSIFLMESGDYPQAEIILYQQRKLTGDSASIAHNLAWVKLEQNDLVGALDEATRAHAMAPDNPRVLDTYGWFLSLNDRNEEALTYLDRALSKEPSHLGARYHRARVNASLGNLDTAAEELREIIETPGTFRDREAAREMLELLQ